MSVSMLLSLMVNMFFVCLAVCLMVGFVKYGFFSPAVLPLISTISPVLYCFAM